MHLNTFFRDATTGISDTDGADVVNLLLGLQKFVISKELQQTKPAFIFSMFLIVLHFCLTGLDLLKSRKRIGSLTSYLYCLSFYLEIAWMSFQ